jgi:hypothetical protein
VSRRDLARPSAAKEELLEMAVVSLIGRASSPSSVVVVVLVADAIRFLGALCTRFVVDGDI